jgi:hypothetical protein
VGFVEVDDVQPYFGSASFNFYYDVTTTFPSTVSSHVQLSHRAPGYTHALTLQALCLGSSG